MSKQRVIHHGEIIEKAIRESGYALTIIAKKMGRSRNHLYNLFQYNKIPYETILEIGKIINYDFSTEIYALQVENMKIETINNNETLYWKEKYYDLLEEHHKLLKSKIIKKS